MLIIFAEKKMNDPSNDFYKSFLSSSSANFVFAVLFFIGAYLKTRLNKSKCAGNCYCFECESSIAQLTQLENKLTRTQTTQREMLHEIVKHIRKTRNEDKDSKLTLSSSEVSGNIV